jgi:hypothetical protein
VRLPRPAALAAALVLVVVVALGAEGLRELSQPTAVDFRRRDMSLRSLHAGCYEITVGRWIPNWQPGHGIVDVAGLYRLDTAAGTPAMREGRSHYQEVGQLLIRPGWLPGSAYWMPRDSNSLQLIWSTGFNGINAVLERASSGYAGRAYSRTDVVMGVPQPRASMRAEPIPCSLVPADTSREPGRHARYRAERNKAYDSIRSLQQSRRR